MYSGDLHSKLYTAIVQDVVEGMDFFFFPPFLGVEKSIPKMLTRISVCGISSGKLIKLAAVLCWAIILKLSTSGLAKAELGLL